MKNIARIYRFDDLSNLELLVANFSDHQFDAHWHETWSIGVVLRGANDSSPNRNGDHIVKRGQISAIAPGQIHGGSAIGQDGCHYFMFYPSTETILKAAESMEIKLASVHSGFFYQPELSQKLCAAASVLTNSQANNFEREESWIQALAEFINTIKHPSFYGFQKRDYIPLRSLMIAKEYLHDNYVNIFQLDELSKAAGMSKFHLCRQFTSTFGLSPSRYQRQLKLQKAKVMLSFGENIAQVAIACGFADQSHLSRLFKLTYGVTPGSYRDRG
ncbi:AraC family transcriptional regulator [Yersinia enterocolitica]|uniref:AraC family transcriptional regulator n=1 Tax=Yersinia TaxID=629 RepID=UPI003AB2A24F